MVESIAPRAASKRIEFGVRPDDLVVLLLQENDHHPCHVLDPIRHIGHSKAAVPPFTVTPCGLVPVASILGHHHRGDDEIIAAAKPEVELDSKSKGPVLRVVDAREVLAGEPGIVGTDVESALPVGDGHELHAAAHPGHAHARIDFKEAPALRHPEVSVGDVFLVELDRQLVLSARPRRPADLRPDLDARTARRPRDVEGVGCRIHPERLGDDLQRMHHGPRLAVPDPATPLVSVLDKLHRDRRRIRARRRHHVRHAGLLVCQPPCRLSMAAERSRRHGDANKNSLQSALLH